MSISLSFSFSFSPFIAYIPFSSSYSDQGYDCSPYDSRQPLVPLPGQEMGFHQQASPFGGTAMNVTRGRESIAGVFLREGEKEREGETY